jgi:hypothetical protein
MALPGSCPVAGFGHGDVLPEFLGRQTLSPTDPEAAARRVIRQQGIVGRGSRG